MIDELFITFIIEYIEKLYIKIKIYISLFLEI